MMGTTVRFGLPMALQQGSVSLGHLLLQGLINPFGTVVIGAFASASKIDLFTLMPTMDSARRWPPSPPRTQGRGIWSGSAGASESQAGWPLGSARCWADWYGGTGRG